MTVAIPTFNRGEMLRPLLESVRKNARPGDELIVSDDGSTDETALIVQSFSEFRLVRHDQNVGMVENWNTCLRLASREWICILHDDDILLPGGLDALRCVCAKVAQPALITHWHNGDDTAGLRYRYSAPGRWSVLNCPTIPSGAVIHRSILDDSGFFDAKLKYSSDLEYFPRICTRHPLVVIENPQVLRYNLHGGNYQFVTWAQPDFLHQLEVIEGAVLTHAGISGETRERMIKHKMDEHCTHMFEKACRYGDRKLIQRLGNELASRSSVRWRKRLKGRLAPFPAVRTVLDALPRPFR
jgi:glycosyltransferase involved in cell wall biosynthesis